MDQTTNKEQLWLELGPLSGEPPQRLIIGLHSAGSSPEAFVPVALNWQFKFKSAAVAIIYEPTSSDGRTQEWVPKSALTDEHALDLACIELSRRIRSAQLALGVDWTQTMVVGHGIGASIALETLRRDHQLASIITTYAGRLASRLAASETFPATVHLIHGTADSIVPVQLGQNTLRDLLAVHTPATLDVITDASHRIDQEMINISTARVMQTIFKGRKKTPAKLNPAPRDITLH